MLPREPSEVDGSAVVEGASGVLRAANRHRVYMRISDFWLAKRSTHARNKYAREKRRV